jgi:hypothetical protein
MVIFPFRPSQRNVIHQGRQIIQPGISNKRGHQPLACSSDNEPTSLKLKTLLYGSCLKPFRLRAGKYVTKA